MRAALLLFFAAQLATAQPYIYVPNDGVSSLLVVDTKTNSVVANVPNPGGYPQQAAFTPDGKTLYIASQGSSGSGSVSVFDAATNTMTGLIAVGALPEAVAVTPDGQYLYVTNGRDSTVSVIRTGTLSVIATVPVGFNPWGIAASPDGSKLYVANMYANSVSVIRTTTNTVVSTWTLMGTVRETAVNPAGTVLWATDITGNKAWAVDTATGMVIATVPLGSSPDSIAITPDGKRVYVANRYGNTVSVVDAASYSVVATIPTGLTPSGIAISADGTRAYVCNSYGFTVNVIDTASNAVIATTAPLAVYLTGVYVCPVASPPLGKSFYTLTPCRVADTRNPVGPYGGPALAANADRSFVIANQCGIPTTATAVSFNVTITQPTGLGDLRLSPGGASLPLVSTLNWKALQTRANNAIVSLGPSGDIGVHVDQVSGTVHLIIDVNGYFQ